MSISHLHWRYATKQFDADKKIPADTWQQIEQSLVLTPSSFGLQPWKFFVIDDSDMRSALRDKSWGQSQVTDASHFIVMTHRRSVDEAYIDQWIAELARVQGSTPEKLSGYRDVLLGFVANMTPEQMNAWNHRQAYIALGQLMTVAAEMKIDTCPMEGIDPAAYDTILGLDGSPFTTSVGCALGYRSADDKYSATPKARFSHEAVIEHI